MHCTVLGWCNHLLTIHGNYTKECNSTCIEMLLLLHLLSVSGNGPLVKLTVKLSVYYLINLQLCTDTNAERSRH